MGKNRILKTPTYLSVFVCCFISGAFAQAATFTVNSPCSSFGNLSDPNDNFG